MKTKVVLLAAGKSTRTSEMKQLYKIDGEYLINVQIKKLLLFGFEVVVVLGHRYEELVRLVDKRVEVVYNAEYEEGVFSSVKAVFKNVDAEQFLFCHIDRPIANRDVYLSLMQSKKEVAVAFCCGKKAPPIMMHSTVKEELLASTLTRLDYWIKDFNEVEYVSVNDGKIHQNANSDAELEKYFF